MKIGLIDKAKIHVKNSDDNGFKISANNLRMNMFPETVREL